MLLMGDAFLRSNRFNWNHQRCRSCWLLLLVYGLGNFDMAAGEL